MKLQIPYEAELATELRALSTKGVLDLTYPSTSERGKYRREYWTDKRWITPTTGRPGHYSQTQAFKDLA